MDITKTLGNNVLLRFGTRLCALQNVIKILLMGQRGVETRGGKAARSRRAHMGAGRPCVRRREGGKQPGRAPVLPLPSLHPFLTCLSPSWPGGSARLDLFFHPPARFWGYPSAAGCAAAQWAGMQAGMASVWERKYSKIPLQQQGHGSGCKQWSCPLRHGGGTGACSPVPAPALPRGYRCLPGDGGNGTGRGQAAPGWPPSSESVTAAAGERKGKKHAV